MYITQQDIEKSVGFPLDDISKNQIVDYNLEYTPLSAEEQEQYIIDFVRVLTMEIVKSGSHRISSWEDGWEENLTNFSATRDINQLIPKYHSKNTYVRWDERMVLPASKDFDYKLHILIVDSIIRKYLKDVDSIFEFGCGPGYHLIRLHDYFPNKRFMGSDWTTASQRIISRVNELLNFNIEPYNVNFFEPDYGVDIPANTGIYTIAALEQVGENFKEFIDYLLVKKPKICVHFEPIDELLDNSKLLDFLTIKYFRKRNYLKGFLPYLQELERQGKIRIIETRRTLSGSYFIEGHSLIVWEPIL